jgi:hypothetical protein
MPTVKPSTAPHFGGANGRATTALGEARTSAQNRRNAAYSWNSNRPEPVTPAWYAEHPNAWKFTHPHADATRVIHLFVDRNGAVRGSQFDLISEDVQTVQGTVTKSSLLATWTIGKGQTTVFEAALAELTKPEGAVTVRFADGKTATWKAVRVTK